MGVRGNPVRQLCAGIALLLSSAGASAQDSAAQAQQSAPGDTASQTGVEDPPPPIVVEGQKEKKVCRTETSTGSIMARRVCRTQSQIDRERAAMERDLEQQRTRDEAEANYRLHNRGN